MTRRILCVCLGNTCRSPMAEGALDAMARAAGHAVEVDSAGLGAWHVGKPPQPQGIAAAARRGYDTRHQRTRMVTAEDFHRFDLILAMDRENVAGLERLRPPGAAVEVRLLDVDGRDIPDPWGGTDTDYDLALNMIEDGVRALLAELRSPG